MLFVTSLIVLECSENKKIRDEKSLQTEISAIQMNDKFNLLFSF